MPPSPRSAMSSGQPRARAVRRRGLRRAAVRLGHKYDSQSAGAWPRPSSRATVWSCGSCYGMARTEVRLPTATATSATCSPTGPGRGLAAVRINSAALRRERGHRQPARRRRGGRRRSSSPCSPPRDSTLAPPQCPDHVLADRHRRPARAARFHAARHPGRRTGSQGLVRTALLGLAGFVAFAVFSVIILRTAAAGRGRTRGAAPAEPGDPRSAGRSVTGLDKRLLDQRGRDQASAGREVVAGHPADRGRLGFDFGCLLAALRATGADPQPSVVLLALRGRGHCRPVAAHPRRPGHRGSQPDRPAGPGRRARRSRRPGRPRLPDRLLLASPPRRRRPPTCSTGAVTDGRSSGAPRQARMASRREARQPPA